MSNTCFKHLILFKFNSINCLVTNTLCLTAPLLVQLFCHALPILRRHQSPNTDSLRVSAVHNNRVSESVGRTDFAASRKSDHWSISYSLSIPRCHYSHMRYGDFLRHFTYIVRKKERTKVDNCNEYHFS